MKISSFNTIFITIITIITIIIHTITKNMIVKIFIRDCLEAHNLSGIVAHKLSGL